MNLDVFWDSMNLSLKSAVPVLIEKFRNAIRFWNKQICSTYAGKSMPSSRKFKFINLCILRSDFYLRRFRNQVSINFDSALYEESFTRWKNRCESTVGNSQLNDDTTIPATQNIVEEKSASIPTNQIHDFESQMSPLIYQSSESGEH